MKNLLSGREGAVRLPARWVKPRKLIAGVAVLVMLAGCGRFPAGSAGPAEDDCYPHAYRIRVIKQVVHGFIQVECDTRPRSYTATAQLIYRPQGYTDWQNTGAPSLPDSRIPSPDVKYHVSAVCTPGNYRVQVTVSGVSSTGSEGQAVARSAPFRVSDCSKNSDSGVHR